MTASLVQKGPWCGCQGCRDPADVVIHHPDYGRRAVCADHAGDHDRPEVLSDD